MNPVVNYRYAMRVAHDVIPLRCIGCSSTKINREPEGLRYRVDCCACGRSYLTGQFDPGRPVLSSQTLAYDK